MQNTNNYFLLFLLICVLLISNIVYCKILGEYEIKGVKYYIEENKKYKQRGTASWYGPGFHKNYTASGEVFNKYKLSAAHKTLPLHSIVKVTNLENKKSIKVRINDRGPFVDGRIIDLSEKAAIKLGFKEDGITQVEVKYIKQHKKANKKA